ncbi:hypothetical protein [Streptomyces tsukubensis]|uniref:hypothetical protein n=1 Tax=Streptomyces tsukubensis TaxID=83656 RepID=UPI00344DE786
MTDLVLKELRLRHAELDLRAEKARIEQRATVTTSPRALVLGRKIKELQAAADGYAALIEEAEEMR